MKISYYLNEGRKKNLYCRISDGMERVTFSLDYAVDAKDWNSKKEEINDENEYYYTLIDFKRYLTKRYHEFQAEDKDKILERLKNEALSFTKESGLEGIARCLFDYSNQENDVPKYDEFVQAFEKFSKLKKGNYKVETIGSEIHFHTDDNIFEMNTYEGLTCSLKSYIERRSYEEIYTMTSRGIWSEIFIDPGIEKHKFIPKILQEWELYWANIYREIKEEVGKTDHLDAQKQQSWRQFQAYMACYNGDAIELAYEIDEYALYPMSVLTMMQIFDAETCYSEYCEFEFDGSGEWESISLKEDDNSPIFFIREYEF